MSFLRHPTQAAPRTAVRRTPFAVERPRDAVPDLVGLPGNAVPRGGIGGIFTAPDGIRLRYALWPGPPVARRGTVCLLQGRADHMEKYFETVTELQARGFAVAAFDWRGQGGSERLLADPRQGHVDDMALYTTELDAFLRDVVLPRLPGPVIGLAHSMGAAVLLHALSRRPEAMAGAVLTSPMVALSRQIAPPLAGVAAALACTAGLGRVALPDPQRHGDAARPFRADNLLTSDEGRYCRILDINLHAPHLAVGRPTIGWIGAAYRAMRPFGNRSFLDRLTTPLLLAAGDSDAVTSTPACITLAGRLPAATVEVLPRCRHEVLLETDAIRGRFWEAFDGFAGRLSASSR